MEIVSQQEKTHSAKKVHVSVEQEDVWNARQDSSSITMVFALRLLKIVSNIAD